MNQSPWRFLSRNRMLAAAAAATLAAVLLGIVSVQTLPFARMGWAALAGPDLQVVQDVRKGLLDQEPFRQALRRHERAAVQRHRRGGASAYQKRHLVRVNLTPFGLPAFHDIFAVRIRTDIVEGEPYTSFLARPGVVFHSNDAPFFSRQCESAACETAIYALVSVGRTLLEWGVLTSFRLNVTEMDETSSVRLGREAISTAEWARQSRRLHEQGLGCSFSTNAP